MGVEMLNVKILLSPPPNDGELSLPDKIPESPDREPHVSSSLFSAKESAFCLGGEGILSQITNKTAKEAKLINVFAELYPIVRAYVTERCFGERIDIENENVRKHLRNFIVQERIASYLAKEIGAVTAEKREIEFEDVRFKLSDTKKFTWRRKHLQCKHTIFNFVATYNDFETDFAEFLDECEDIISFAALAEHFTRFRVDYLSPTGAIKFYYPDFVAVQKQGDGKIVHWIIETKGRVFEALPYKEASIREWCRKVSSQVNEDWHYLRVDQAIFESTKYHKFESLVKAIENQGDTSLIGLI